MTAPVPAYEFDQDTAVQEMAPGVYGGTLAVRWNIGPVPNGGYVLSVGMAALHAALPSWDPLSVTAHFLRPSAPGPVRIEVETIKAGRQYSTATARVIQADRETARILATYGDLSNGGGPIYIGGAPPPLPPRAELTPVPYSNANDITGRFEILLASSPPAAAQAATPAEVAGWLRLADGRQPDVHALGVIVDAFPPAVFQVLTPGWVPTLELTLHVRARPSSQWLRCLFRTRFIFSGLLEEDGEIWDETGALVAMSRQLAALPR